MFCSQCGVELREGMAFCPACGTKVISAVTTSPTVEPPSVESPDVEQSPVVTEQRWWQFPYSAWVLLGIFVPFIGFIASFPFLRNAQQQKKRIGKQLLAASGIGMVLFMIGVSESNSSTPEAPQPTQASETKTPIQQVTETVQDVVAPPVTPEAYKNSCQWIPYENLYRDTEKYIGTNIVYKGEVNQVIEGDDGQQCELRIAVTQGEYGLWDDFLFVTYTRPPDQGRFMDEDIVKVWGVVDGPYTYQSVMSGPITIPGISAQYIEVVE